MCRKNRFSKAFEERLTWKPSDLVILYNHGIDKVREGLHEAYTEHSRKVNGIEATERTVAMKGSLPVE